MLYPGWVDTRLIVIKNAALSAGKEVLKFNPSTVSVKFKSSVGDFVTAADFGSEKVITQIIKTTYPDDVIISEETSKGQELLKPEALSKLTAWVIDPIDGTNNFKHDMAYSGISIAYIENGAAVLGAIYNPFRKELYLAVKGKGSTRNDKPINVSNKQTFDAGTRVCTSNSSEVGNQANLERYAKLGHVWIDVLGSAVLIMTDVASGRLDLYHHNCLKPWDNAAAFLIASEAGAKITDLRGNSVTWLTPDAVVGNKTLVDEFIARTAK